ncbi:Uncharacterised protein [Mycobacteroides abscessus subsp. abscessus]|nr:Uncharacterised protein [Mycobacteroides abscessus subsp. abscessus]
MSTFAHVISGLIAGFSAACLSVSSMPAVLRSASRMIAARRPRSCPAPRERKPQ